jgi:hypothetical protein
MKIITFFIKMKEVLWFCGIKQAGNKKGAR